MPLQRTLLKTAPADLHLLRRPGDLTANSTSSVFLPDNTLAALEIELVVTFQGRGSISGLRPQRQEMYLTSFRNAKWLKLEKQLKSFNCKTSTRWPTCEAADVVGRRVKRLVGWIERASDRVAVSRDAKLTKLKMRPTSASTSTAR